jgi:hypothetical protein
MKQPDHPDIKALFEMQTRSQVRSIISQYMPTVGEGSKMVGYDVAAEIEKVLEICGER